MARKDRRLAEHMADGSPSGLMPVLGFILLGFIIYAIVQAL